MKLDWFRDREAWSLIGRGYLPWLAGLNLAWETAQLPLYTVWTRRRRHLLHLRSFTAPPATY